jgi:NADH:ubiquinone oxidoreductase subunit D
VQKLPAGPVSVNDPRVTLPEKSAVYTKTEAVIRHFKLIIDGIQVPAGEVYSAHEAPNGELGFYLVSDGDRAPYRLRCRGACFYIFQAFNQMIKGGYISDAIAALGSLNIVAGELEK